MREIKDKARRFIIAMMPNVDANTQLFALAQNAMPGGAPGGWSPPPVSNFVFVGGRGAQIWDANGRYYDDYVCGSGALILGHSHAAVVDAAVAQIQRGVNCFGVVADVTATLAARLKVDIPCAQKIIFATTGSDAVGYAMRLARAHTGREKILKFAGAYHGNQDYTLSESQSVLSSGIPAAVAATMFNAPYNDADAVETLMKQHDFAAVLVEPMQRIIVARPGFLAALRQLCDKHNTVLIFDEIITGFRVSYGGAQALCGVLPDIAVYGKIIGGGGALSVLGGRADILNLCEIRRRKNNDTYVHINGTLHGNPLAAAMTMAVLDELSRPGVYHKLHAFADSFCRACEKVLQSHDLPAIVVCRDSMWQILFMRQPPQNATELAAGDTRTMHRLDIELWRRGQYTLPGARKFFSTAHGDEQQQRFLQALDDSCIAVKKYKLSRSKQ